MQRATRFCFWKKCKATGGRKERRKGSKSAIIYDVAKGIYFGKKRGDKTQFEQAVKKAKDNNI